MSHDQATTRKSEGESLTAVRQDEMVTPLQQDEATLPRWFHGTLGLLGGPIVGWILTSFLPETAGAARAVLFILITAVCGVLGFLYGAAFWSALFQSLLGILRGPH